MRCRWVCRPGVPAWAWQLVLALFACWALPALAQPEPSRVWPDRHVTSRIWVDDSGHASVRDARAAFDAGQGRQVNADEILPLGHGHAVWYEIVFPPLQGPVRAVLEIPFPGLDSAELFRPDGAGGWQAQRSGDSVPVANWPVRHLYPTFTFTAQPAEPQPTYLRVQHGRPIGLSWSITDSAQFGESNKMWHMMLGGYVGFVVFVLLLSLTNALAWRDTIHLYFAGHVLSFSLGLMSISGLAGEYLWPANAWWNDIAPAFLPAVSLGLLGLFVRKLVTERGERLVPAALLLHVVLCTFVALGLLVGGRDPFFRWLNVYAPVGMALALVAVARFASRRPQVGLWVLAGLLVMVAAWMLPTLSNLGLLPISEWTQHVPMLTGLVELPLVLTGLYYRSRERRDNRLRLEGLARADPLTGVANHRVLLDKLERLIQRARREPLAGAMLRVRVANLPTIRNEYGREAAEAAMLQAAECVGLEAREGDTLGRHDSGDLVLLLEGRSTALQLATSGRNIIARGLKFSARLPPQVTLSLRIAAVCAPLPPHGARTLLDELGRILDEMEQAAHARPFEFLGTPAHDDSEAPGERVPGRGEMRNAAS